MEEEKVEYYKEEYKYNLEAANLESTGNLVFYLAHVLPKNSPWTPIVSLGFRMLEEQGIIERHLRLRKDEFLFSSEADGIPLNKVYLLFMFIAAFFALSLFSLILEWIWVKYKLRQ